jgi:hypothetical protein
MCDKCQQLETNIQRYRRLVAMRLDPLTIESVNELIRELEQRKEAMH